MDIKGLVLLCVVVPLLAHGETCVSTWPASTDVRETWYQAPRDAKYPVEMELKLAVTDSALAYWGADGRSCTSRVPAVGPMTPGVYLYKCSAPGVCTLDGTHDILLASTTLRDPPYMNYDFVDNGLYLLSRGRVYDPSNPRDTWTEADLALGTFTRYIGSPLYSGCLEDTQITFNGTFSGNALLLDGDSYCSEEIVHSFDGVGIRRPVHGSQCSGGQEVAFTRGRPRLLKASYNLPAELTGTELRDAGRRHRRYVLVRALACNATACTATPLVPAGEPIEIPNHFGAEVDVVCPDVIGAHPTPTITSPGTVTLPATYLGCYMEVSPEAVASPVRAADKLATVHRLYDGSGTTKVYLNEHGAEGDTVGYWHGSYYSLVNGVGCVANTPAIDAIAFPGANIEGVEYVAAHAPGPAFGLHLTTPENGVFHTTGQLLNYTILPDMYLLAGTL